MLLNELSDLQKILDADRDPVDKEVVETAIQALLFHQVVYDDTPGVPREAIATIRRHRIFFDRYFNAAGFRLRIEANEQMIALEPGRNVYGWRQNRLKKDETLVRIALRLILDEGFKSGSMDDAGRVATDTDEIVDMFRTLARTEAPPEGRMNDILRELHRLGGVRLGDRNTSEHVREITLLPGLRVHVPDVFVEGVILWIERGCPGDMFEFDTERRREAAEAAEAAETDTAEDDGDQEAEFRSGTELKPDDSDGPADDTDASGRQEG